MPDTTKQLEAERYGIAEWYGHLITNLTPEERIHFAKKAISGSKSEVCPHRLVSNPKANCSKAGGVCSIRLYEHEDDALAKISVQSPEIVTTCPSRFWENNTIFHWIGETILKDINPAVIKEVGFLKTQNPKGQQKDVGKIDTILVSEGGETFHWCAVELQAVYFSGTKMEVEFDPFIDRNGEIPFPKAIRRPDFRSSGPKRLMPQLQIKVPTLRRWGIKTAVVVDQTFYSRFAPSTTEDDLTNADIAWFVVGFDDRGKLTKEFVTYATLEDTVIGLTAGTPTTKTEFEAELKQCLSVGNPTKVLRLS